MNNLDKIVAGDKLTSSGQSNSEIIEALRAVSPEVFTDGKVDFELLRNALGEVVEDSEERYGLNWNGKRHSMRVSRTHSFGILRPVNNDGRGDYSTANSIIEGDNLEVLKLLQKSYTGKVKMIYIDPPYNTGNDFVYPDDFEQSMENYLEVTGQSDDDGKKISTNTETSGRFHSNWLNMMYPRLRLARNLLRKDGAIFVSIDDNEMVRLRSIMDEIFGPENFVESLIIKSNPRGNQAKKHTATSHEYVLVYAMEKPSLEPLATQSDSSEYNKEDEVGKYREIGLRKRGAGSRRIDAPNQYYPIYFHEGTSTIYVDNPPEGSIEIIPRLEDGGDGRWRWAKQSVTDRTNELLARRVKKKFSGTSEFDVFQKDYWGKGKTTKIKSIIDDKGVNYQNGTVELKGLFENQKIFDYPKPTYLIQRLIDCMEIEGDEIIVDLFAGSGTTGHAVLDYNCSNQKNLRYVLVQLPELLEVDSDAANFLDSIGKPNNIAEITKERMRRVAAKIMEKNPDYEGDLGFKVFKQDSSNIKEWDGGPEDLQKSLEDYVNQIKDDRTSMDILYEVMLKSGIQLTAEIEEIEVGDNKVLSVDNCRLLACLDKEIKSDAVAEIASAIVELKNANLEAACMVLFLDSAFADSSAKLNMSETLKQNGFSNIRSI